MKLLSLALWVVCIVVAILFAAFVLLIIWGVRKRRVLYRILGDYKWHTLEELEGDVHPLRSYRAFLVRLHRERELEIRKLPESDLRELDKETIRIMNSRLPFQALSVEGYEFRLISRGGRRRRPRFLSMRISDFVGQQASA